MRLNLTARLLTAAACATLLAATPNIASAQPTAPHVFFRVQLANIVPGPVSGRLLVFLKQGKGDKDVDIQEFHPG